MASDLYPASAVVDAKSDLLSSVSSPGVSWAAVAAGAVATSALTLVLVAFGAGIGLSAISPWSDSGVSASTFKTGTGIYLIIVAVMSSAVGGYLAGRLRVKWVNVHTHEVFFRDTAHGFLAWAFATLIAASALGSATSYLANGVAGGAAAGASTAARSVNPSDIYVDRLFRTDSGTGPANNAASGAAAPTAPASPPDSGSANAGAPNANASNATTAGTPSNGNSNQSRMEVSRLWSASLRDGGDLTAADRTYVAHLVAARTGLSEADAQKRVDDTVTAAKTAADNARKGAAKLSLWLTAAMLFGAFAASLAAAEGGSLRDGTWNDRVLTPRAL